MFQIVLSFPTSVVIIKCDSINGQLSVVDFSVYPVASALRLIEREMNSTYIYMACCWREMN